MLTEEVLKLIFETSGTEKLVALDKSTANYKALIVELDKAQKAGEITMEEMMAGMAKYGAELQRETKLLEALREYQAKANQAVAAAGPGVYDLADAYDLVEQAEKKFVVSTADVVTATKQMADAQERATASKTKADAANKSVAGSTMNLGRIALEASRGIEDMQYGIAGVINNVPGVVMAFGGSMGLTAAISLCSVGINQLVKHYDELLGVFSSKEPFRLAVAGLDEIKAHIEELEKKPVKLSVDQTEIDAAKKKLRDLQTTEQAFNQFRGIKGEHERQAGEQAEQLLGMAPGGARKLADDLAAAIGKRLVADDGQLADLQRQFDAAKRSAQDNRTMEASERAAGVHGAAANYASQAIEAEKKVKALADAIDRRRKAILGDDLNGVRGEAHREVGGLFAGVTAGNNPEARKKLAEELKKIGQGRLAREIAGTTPEMVAQAEKEETADRHQEADVDMKKFLRSLEKSLKTREEKEEHTRLAGPLEALAKASDIAEQAAKAIPVAQKQGGLTGEDGRFQKAETPEAQFELVKAVVESEIRKRLAEQGIAFGASSNKTISGAASTIMGTARSRIAAEKAKATADAKAAKTKNAADTKKQVEAQIEAENASLKAGGYDARAAAMLAQLQAQGGMNDKYGRFHRMNNDQMMVAVNRMIQQQLAAHNPGMDPQRREDLATVATVRANANIQQQMMHMQASGLDNTQKLIAIASQLAGAVTQLQQHTELQGQQIQQLITSTRPLSRTRQSR